MRKALPALLVLVLALTMAHSCYGWQNGWAPGMNVACSKCYGTHDFLAEHALAFLSYEPTYFWLEDTFRSTPHNVFASEEYLYGTELPDLGGSGFKPDWALHAVYYGSDGSLEDDYAAKRAQEYYQHVLDLLKGGNPDLAARYMGIVSHYVTDATSYWHVMGKGRDWVNAAKNGQAYENWVNGETDKYSAPFASCLSFDGELERVSAYDETLKLAYDTTFDTSGSGRTAYWMDGKYNTGWPHYRERVCESLNLAANAVADLIYSAMQPATETSTIVSTTAALTNEAATSTVTVKTLTSLSNVTVTVTNESVPTLGTMLPIAVSFALAIVVLWIFVRSRWKPAQSSVFQDKQTSGSAGKSTHEA